MGGLLIVSMFDNLGFSAVSRKIPGNRPPAQPLHQVSICAKPQQYADTESHLSLPSFHLLPHDFTRESLIRAEGLQEPIPKVVRVERVLGAWHAQSTTTVAGLIGRASRVGTHDCAFR